MTQWSGFWLAGGSALVVVTTGAAVFFGPAMALASLVGLCLCFWALSAKTKRAATLVVGALVVAVVVIPMNRLGEDAEALKVAAPAGVLFLTLVLALRFGIRPTRLAVALGVYLGSFALATAVRPDTNEWALFALIGAISIAGFAAGEIIARTGIWSRIAKLVVLLASAQSVYAVVEMLARLEPLWRGSGTLSNGTHVGGRSELIVGFTRAQGTFGSPLLLCFFLLIALVIVMRGEFPAQRASRALVMILLVAGMVAAGGRSALLLALAIWLLGTGRPVARLVKVVGVGLIGLVVVLPRAGDAITDFMATGSFTHRLGALESVERLFAMRNALSNLLGDGSGSTVRLFQMGALQNDGLEAVDNQLVLTFAEAGLLGLIILAAIFINALRAASGTTRLALTICVIEFFVFDALAWTCSAFLIWMFIGYADSIHRSPTELVDDAKLQDRSGNSSSERRRHETEHLQP